MLGELRFVEAASMRWALMAVSALVGLGLALIPRSSHSTEACGPEEVGERLLLQLESSTIDGVSVECASPSGGGFWLSNGVPYTSRVSGTLCDPDEASGSRTLELMSLQ